MDENQEPSGFAVPLALCATGAPHTHSMSCSTDRAMTDEIGAAVRSY
jgi:hypothetical protein